MIQRRFKTRLALTLRTRVSSIKPHQRCAHGGEPKSIPMSQRGRAPPRNKRGRQQQKRRQPRRLSRSDYTEEAKRQVIDGPPSIRNQQPHTNTQQIHDILHICIVLTLHSCMFWSFRLGIMHFSFLFALHKSLSGVGVSFGVLGGTWKHLGSKREWKVLFERVEHWSRQWERPTTPAPDQTKAARGYTAGFGTRSKPTPHLQLSSGQDGARSATRTQFEDVKLAFRAASRSRVRHPLRAQLLVDNSLEAERPGGATS
ncbi:hypothetical protein F2Q69_00061675 [Brassica cretica]|uniref:Uncharacterized protein n=1 Tax=Brassica cretica TaxID=69181 RepID=A0A8S9RNM6_BRACR|nr:hypothetical protein F2Q69_00061675 [Brassica cretica]